MNKTASSLRKLFNLLRLSWAHYLFRDNRIKGIWRIIKWRWRLALNKKIVIPYVNKSKLVLSKDIEGVNNNCYVGLSEFESMSFLLHFLKGEDLFVDVGAYAGVYTVLASAVIGARALAIEPIPNAYSRLLENIRENGVQDKVTALNIGLSDSDKVLWFDSSLGTRNRVVKDTEINNTCVSVQVRRLDDLIKDDKPALIKIDVEGYVTPILRGAETTLKNDSLKAIIVEIWKQTVPAKLLIDNGFRPYSYDPLLRRLSECDYAGKNDLIFLRDVEFIKKRLNEAPKFKVLDRYI